jgi:hypothetical protein
MTEISYSGPLFDGSAAAMVEQMLEAVRTTVAGQALVEWESGMEEHIRHSGPVYQTYAQARDEGGTERVVNDGWGETNDLPYGPWLEGVGSRNSPVTIFPGYHSLRDAFETTTGQVEELAAPVVEEWVEKIND